MGLEPGMQQALSVQISPTQTMTQETYLALLTEKLDRLIQADPKEARWAMDSLFGEMATYHNLEHWAVQIVRSDRMMAILSNVDWEQSLGTGEQQSLAEILEQLA